MAALAGRQSVAHATPFFVAAPDAACVRGACTRPFRHDCAGQREVVPEAGYSLSSSNSVKNDAPRTISEAPLIKQLSVHLSRRCHGGHVCARCGGPRRAHLSAGS